ncbi:MAG: thioredoxin family protein [Anaerolineales bacterium]|nr:thioredoxin family protein [Anaerolineales bacterium]
MAKRRTSMCVAVVVVAAVIVVILGERNRRHIRVALPTPGNFSPTGTASRVDRPLSKVEGFASQGEAGKKTEPHPPSSQPDALPRLVDLGAHTCIPCRMMAPVLAELQRNYSDVFNTEFIDVWRDPSAGQRYGVRVIPTQIFFDATGRELFRHEGYFSKDDILNTWRRLGVDVSKK